MTMMNVMWIANPYSKLRRIANPPQRNYWRGKTEIQLNVKDMKFDR